jgi:hypothetical protein
MMQISERITWTSPNGDVEIIVSHPFADLYQVAERLTGTAGDTPQPYATEAEARADAKLRAEIIRYNQTGR